MSNSITSKFIGHYLPWLTLMLPQQPLKEALCSLSVPTLLQEYINYFTVLVDSSPQVKALILDLHKDLINEERIAVALMLSSQSLGVLRSELIAP